MSISLKDVEKAAELARLELKEEEKEQFTEQLNAILNFAQKLNELDTEQIEPTSHGWKMTNVLREDDARDSLPREAVLLNAPDEDEGQFKVPAVIE